MHHKPTSTISVFMAADDLFAMPLAVTAYSLLTHLTGRPSVTLYVADGGIREENKRRIQRVTLGTDQQVDLRWVVPDRSVLTDLPTTEAINEVAYYRLLMPDMVDRSCLKILYLDTDLLVRHDVSPLWSTDLRHHPLAAVRDYGGPCTRSTYQLARTYRTLGLTGEEPCFNSGVLLVNLDIWRRTGVAQRAFDYLERFRERVHLLDQEALNAVMAGNWVQLDDRWNCQLGALHNIEHWEDSEHKKRMQQRARSLTENAYIYHFIGALKPWTVGRFKPFGRLYCDYLRRSGYFTPEEYHRWARRWTWQSSLRVMRAMRANPTLLIRKIRSSLSRPNYN